MSGGNVGVADLFHLLESNKLEDVEEIKKVFHEHFLSTKDNWLVNGLFDYYLSTNSLRAIEVLSGVREPHDKHLLDRLAETLGRSGGHGHRVQALTLLGHVARRQPTWLYKLANHALFSHLLKLLKLEGDTLSLMSALLLLVTLLPMLPSALGPYLQEIFEVFGRLASYHQYQSSSLAHTSGSNSIDRDQLYLLHLQVGLYSLFHRLYALYPCNFIAYLRVQYTQRDQLGTFTHTIRPMLESVRMHPLLVTASKDQETNAARWKKMEHHDVVAECGRFAVDRSRDEVLGPSNSRATPILDYQCAYTPVTGSVGLSATGGTSTGDEETFWSPSMAVPPQSPPPLQTGSHETRSTPSTPNNNRSNSSPPEAAVEATPETTPVKDMRQGMTRQPPVGSSAVRALSALGNGALSGSSRPATPTPLNFSGSAFAATGVGGGDGNVLSQKIGKLVAERQSVLQQSQRSSFNAAENIGKLLESSPNQNGKNDSWNEDQEVLEIVSSQAGRSEGLSRIDLEMESYNEEITREARADLSRKVQRIRFYSQCQPSIPCTIIHPSDEVRRARSCPDMKIHKKMDIATNEIPNISGGKRTEETGTQTCGVIPYEHLLVGIFPQRNSEQQQQQQQQHHQPLRQNSDSRLSPSSMLDRYVEACARFSGSSNGEKSRSRMRKKGIDDDANEETGDDGGLDADTAHQQLQLMQMQLQFERQRREVHAERNRRLLGKLRDSRALEEYKAALTDRLRIAEKEVEGLKSELDRSKKDARAADDKYMETLRHWQSKCVEEQQHNRLLRNRAEILELELKDEKKKVNDCEQQTRAAEAAFFDAAHQLKGALKAASRGEELKRILDNVQKRFLLLGEAQTKLQERTVGPVSMARQEAAQIQRSYAEELSNLRRQLDSRGSLIEALRARLVELEAREARKETQLVDQHRLLQEAKDRHESELRAVESKYKAQVEINLLLEGRILELHGYLEVVTSSAPPKERSPPLSGSLASSSEGSLAFHSGAGFMNEFCDSAGEIPNLQAIVEPAPSTSQATTPSRARRE